MNIVFFGTPSFVIPVIEKLHAHHTIKALVTTPDQKVGREQKLTPSDVKNYGITNHLPVITPETFTNEVLAQLEQMQPDIFVVASYGKIIPDKLLNVPKHGAINIHPSLLPKFRGASPIPATILSGDNVGGVSIIEMDDEVDHGPIIAQQTYQLKDSDTTESLLPILFEVGADLLLEHLEDYISEKVIPTPQNHEEATFCERFTKDDAYIDAANLPDKIIIDRMIRAYTPWPIVWTKLQIRDQEVRIKFYPGNEVQLEGKKRMPVKEFLKGYPEMEETLRKVLNF